MYKIELGPYALKNIIFEPITQLFLAFPINVAFPVLNKRLFRNYNLEKSSKKR